VNGQATRVVAAFDFDGTLTRRDTLLPFLVDVAGPTVVAQALARDAPQLAAMAFGRYDRDVAKANLVARVLAGRAYGDVVSRGRKYATRVINGRLRSASVARLRWHVEQGHEVVIVSASLDAYLHEIAQRLGVATVLCTTLEVDGGGTITGRLTGGNCRGPEKVARLRAHLGEEPVTLWAYGDSEGDEELLAMADHPVRVTRRGRLVAADGSDADGRA
jgi:HAD superfamily hydrolase (TIGR01490 family)